MRPLTTALLFAILTALSLPTPSLAGCGCDKPPPPRQAIRPFVAHADQTISIFNTALDSGKKYDVQFVSLDGTQGWSRGKSSRRRDFADGQQRQQLRVKVPPLGFGPCQVSVWSQGAQVFAMTDDKLTITGDPVLLHEFTDAVNQINYRAGVDRFGTIYIPVDVSQVDGATRYTGAALGFPVSFQPSDIVMYNEQGFLMQMLDPSNPGLFDLWNADGDTSSVLSYWRHEFRTYKWQHRWLDQFSVSDDEDWHDNGTYHVDHDHIVLAVTGKLPDGSRVAPGATAPFQLVIMSQPEERTAAATSNSGPGSANSGPGSSSGNSGSN